MNHNWTKSAWLSITALIFTFAYSTHLVAQAAPTASTPLDISVFAGYTRTYPDYGQTKNPGITFGFDFAHYFKFPIVPSLEARANISNGTVVNEKTFLFGIRADPKLRGRFHPYGDFLIGPGYLHYNQPTGFPGYTGDNSVVKSIGGGIDFDVISHFQVKLDVQQQFWNFGSNYTITPTTYMIGVNYRLRPRNSNPR